MSSTVKKKICWNCEGNVSVMEENCPYCAVYIGPAEPEEEEPVNEPPFKMAEHHDIPQPHYQQQASRIQEAVGLDDEPSEVKAVALSVALFTGGVIFLLFGFILWFFSTNGALTLSWESHLWYIYVLLGLPMLFFGWRFVQRLD